MRSIAPAVAVAALLATSPFAFGQGARTVEIVTEKITDHVYMIVGQGGNIGLCVGEDGTFMIDDQFAPLTGPILEAVGKVTDRRVKFLINTHWHFDHTGGNENFAGEGAIIFAHDNVRKRMSTEQVMTSLNDRVQPAAPDAALPVITFAESVNFHLNGDTISAFHVANAHTDGDSIIHFRDNNVFHMGDTFFNGMYPFIDVGSGGGIDGIIAAANTVLNHSDENTKIIPGHGPLATRADLVTYRDVMVGVRDAVATLIKAGTSREEVVAANPTAPWNDPWGNGFMNAETFTGLVYDGLVRAAHD